MDKDGENELIISSYDVYISYSKQDFYWVKDFVAKVEENGFRVCWNNSSIEEEYWISKCLSCILIFSQHYLQQSEEWEIFTIYKSMETNNQDMNKVTIKSVLDSKEIICILISDCKLPDVFNDNLIFNWYDVAYRKSMWNRLMKCLYSAKMKRKVKNTLSSVDMLVDGNGKNSVVRKVVEHNDRVDLENSIHKPTSEQIYVDANYDVSSENISKDVNKAINSCHTPHTDHSVNLNTCDKTEVSPTLQDNKEFPCKFHSSDIDQENQSTDSHPKQPKEEEITPISKIGPGLAYAINLNKSKNLLNFSWTNKIHPHLICDNFTADEDLTKEDVDSLTFKPEDAKTIMELSPSKYQRKKKMIHYNYSVVTEGNVKLTHFSSQHEQMKLVNILQNIHDKMQKKVDLCYCNVSKRRYRRLLKRYHECIILAVNGEKDNEKLNDLPLVNELLTIDDLDGFQCYCCDLLLHSRRALDMHVKDCINRTWQNIFK